MFRASATTAAASSVAVALSDPRVQFAPVQRMTLGQLGSRFQETPPAERASPQPRERLAPREADFGSLDQHSQGLGEAAQPD